MGANERRETLAIQAMLVIHGTYQQEVALRAYNDYMQPLRCYTPAQSIATQSVSIAGLKKYKGDDYTAAVLSMYIDRLNIMVNVTRPITALQIEVYAMQIINDPDFLHFTVSDFATAFNCGLSAKYGSLYEGLDIVKIYEWLRAYDVEKMAHIEMERQKEHSAIRAGEKKVSPLIIEKVREIQNCLSKNAQPEKPPYFLSLEHYCKYYAVSVRQKTKEFMAKALERYSEKIETLHEKRVFIIFFRVKVNEWLKRQNEANGYQSRHNNNSRITGNYTPPDHCKEWQDLNRLQ